MRPLCAFDLDHTLVRSTLDLAAVRADLRDLAVARGVPLPPEAVRWTVEQTIRAVAERAPALRPVCWELVLDHERRALDSAECEPGAPETQDALATAGFPLAVWTNNARPAAEDALGRCGLRGFFATIVTRDEAALKPDPAGLVVLRAAHPERAVWVVGDSWVDGAAALAGGASFVAYNADPGELARRAVVAAASIRDLRELPAWFASL
jgi:phosphoglycolate phosphatase-like HAD superfamily hydrolase